jgi:hypothetical protein
MGIGKEQLSTDNNGNTIGSEKARNHMISVLGNKEVVTGGFDDSKKSQTADDGKSFTLNPSKIKRNINGAVNVDSRTSGWGMVFMHESYHTTIGGSLNDAGAASQTVIYHMNIIRAELNDKGENYGQRTTYNLYNIGQGVLQRTVLPFNRATFDVMIKTLGHISSDKQFQYIITR